MSAESLAQDLEDALNAAPSPHIRRGDAPQALLVTPVVNDLIASAAVDWLVWLAAGAVAMVAPWWLYPLPALVIASRIHGLGVLLHDASHMPLRKKTGAVRLLEAMAGYPLSTTINAMRYHHMRHHRDSGMPSDPYFKPGVGESQLRYALNVARGLLLMPFWSIRPWFGTLSLLIPALQPAYAKAFLQDRSGKDLSNAPEVQACAKAELGQIGWQAAVVSLYFVVPEVVIWAYVVPAVLAGVLAAWRLLQEHNYTPATDRRVLTIFGNTHDHHMDLATGWLLAPHNIGYHVVHHVHPQVAWHQLPALRDWYKQQYDAYPEPK